MVTVIQRPKTTGERFSEAFSNIGQGLGQAIPEFMGRKEEKRIEEQQYQDENNVYQELTGRKLSKNPQIRAKEIEYALKGQNELQNEKTKFENREKETAAKLAGEEKINKELVSFADKLESNNPNSPLHKTVADIYRTELPLNQKTELVKSLTGMDPFKMEQQKRLQLDSVLKRYNTRLKELDSEIANVTNPYSTGKEEAAELRKQRMSLRTERDQLLDFKALNGMEEEEEIEEEAEVEEKSSKVKFNPNNKEHRAKAQQLYNKFKDKEKVRKILSKEFEGL